MYFQVSRINPFFILEKIKDKRSFEISRNCHGNIYIYGVRIKINNIYVLLYINN